MKKLYSLVVGLLVVTTINAQTTVLSESFAAYTLGGNTASTGATAPDSNDVYNNTNGVTFVPTFPTGTKVYQAGGMAKFGTSSLVGSMSTAALDLSTDGGKVSITFDVKGWTTVEGPIIVKVTNMADQSVTYAAVMSGTPETKTITFGGGQANSIVTFATQAKRAYIDNIVIKTDPTIVLAVSDLTKVKSGFVKNTMVSDAIQFSAKADVKVYDVNGQIVRQANVSENNGLDVSFLPNGMYFVTGIVNGQAVSQKILKN